MIVSSKYPIILIPITKQIAFFLVSTPSTYNFTDHMKDFNGDRKSMKIQSLIIEYVSKPNVTFIRLVNYNVPKLTEETLNCSSMNLLIKHR